MLIVREVHKSFGGLKALNGVSLEVERGSITGLIGPNGSGKTTLFNIISGFYAKDAGEIYFKGRRIDGLPPHKIARMGLCRTFQISQIPQRMTVLENMLLAPQGQLGEGVINALFRYRKVLRQERANLEEALSLLELVGLFDSRNEYAGNLSGGQKKLLSLARILMADPDLILLDEPTAGVNPTLIKSLLEVIKRLQSERGKTFLVIEHNMKVISGICNHVYVLNFGEVIAEGTPDEVQRSEEVLEAYLGRRDKRSELVRAEDDHGQ
jgi:ABC-type branched-subunit amino acid transport system ATPase component